MLINNFQNLSGIEDAVKRRYLQYNESFVNAYKNYFLPFSSDSILAIIFYGSCLNDVTKKESSTPDFFLIVKSYGAFHKNSIHSLLNRILTPNTYSINQGELKGKYNVISLKDFQRETSPYAKDIYNLGRLSKRTAIIYSLDNEILNSVIKSIAKAYYTVAEKSFFLVPEKFRMAEFLDSCLRISYIGEKRVEADNKIEKLLKSEEKFYSLIYSLIIEDLILEGALQKNRDDSFTKKIGLLREAFGSLRIKFFLRKSVIRAKMRWPKSIFTFKGWVDVLLAKIERTKGIKLNLTEKERRHPLIYGWKYYFRLKKDKIIK